MDDTTKPTTRMHGSETTNCPRLLCVAPLLPIKPPEERSARGQRKVIEKQRRNAEKAAKVRLSREYEERHGPAALARKAAEKAADCARGQAQQAWRAQVVPEDATTLAMPKSWWVDNLLVAHVG